MEYREASVYIKTISCWPSVKRGATFMGICICEHSPTIPRPSTLRWKGTRTSLKQYIVYS